MADNSDPRRDALHAFLAEQGPPPARDDRAAVLTGWVVVAEWMDDEGERWLSRHFPCTLTQWHAFGMLHEVIYGDWPTSDDDEEGG